MPRANPAWTNTETTDFEAGDVLRADKFEAQVLCNLEHLAQNHDHSGDAGDGGTLPTADPKALRFYPVGGAPFA